MLRTIPKKLVATVVEVTDLDGAFPESVLNGRIGLDIRIEQGSVSIGKRVRLAGPGSDEDLEIIGIEMLSAPHDPGVVRVHCSKPKLQAIPAGKVEGWILAEQ